MKRTSFLFVLVCGAAALIACGSDNEAPPVETDDDTVVVVNDDDAVETDAGAQDDAPPAELTLEERAAVISKMTPDAANGERVYKAHCIDCHGADGESGRAGIRIVGEALTKRDEAILQVLRGGGNMPAFADVLTDQEIVDVIRYVAVL